MGGNQVLATFTRQATPTFNLNTHSEEQERGPRESPVAGNDVQFAVDLRVCLTEIYGICQAEQRICMIGGGGGSEMNGGSL